MNLSTCWAAIISQVADLKGWTWVFRTLLIQFLKDNFHLPVAGWFSAASVWSKPHETSGEQRIFDSPSTSREDQHDSQAAKRTGRVMTDAAQRWSWHDSQSGSWQMLSSMCRHVIIQTSSSLFLVTRLTLNQLCTNLHSGQVQAS